MMNYALQVWAKETHPQFEVSPQVHAFDHMVLSCQCSFETFLETES